MNDHVNMPIEDRKDTKLTWKQLLDKIKSLPDFYQEDIVTIIINNEQFCVNFHFNNDDNGAELIIDGTVSL